MEGLDALVKEEFKRYLEEEVAEMNSLKSVLENRAYGVSDAMEPFYVYQGECGGLD